VAGKRSSSSSYHRVALASQFFQLGGAWPPCKKREFAELTFASSRNRLAESLSFEFLTGQGIGPTQGVS